MCFRLLTVSFRFLLCVAAPYCLLCFAVSDFFVRCGPFLVRRKVNVATLNPRYLPETLVRKPEQNEKSGIIERMRIKFREGCL